MDIDRAILVRVSHEVRLNNDRLVVAPTIEAQLSGLLLGLSRRQIDADPK